MAVAVVKVGTSSVTSASGEIAEASLAKLCQQLARVRADGHKVVLVCSGAIAAGMPLLGLTERPSDIGTLQALAAVGQPRLMERLSALLAAEGLIAGQVLLTPYDFGHREQYLHARETLGRLLDLGVIPIVNENDTVADDEIRYGDNDRLAALVSHLVDANVLVLLTDTDGLYTADPRLDSEASLIEEIVVVDEAHEQGAGGPGTERGSGGMASKLAAAKMASWSGVRVVIAASDAPEVVMGAIEEKSVGTVIQPRTEKLSSRKLWIAFGRASAGRIVVDAGARTAILKSGKSLLPAGVIRVEGDFENDDAVEVVAEDGVVFAKGLVRYSSLDLISAAGFRSEQLPDGSPIAVIHRDDLVMLAS